MNKGTGGEELAKFLNLPDPASFSHIDQELLNEIEFAKLKENSRMKLEDWQRNNYADNEGSPLTLSFKRNHQ